MRHLLLLLFSALTFAAIGDNAPSIPATWVSGHPRLGAPSNAQVIALWNGGSLPSRFTTAANGWDVTCTSPACSTISFRYLLMSYMASKIGDPTCVSTPCTTWKAKLIAMQDLGPVWGAVLLSDDTASATGCSTTCTITDTSVNFSTGCGGSCAGNYLAYLGLRYVVQSVTDSHNIVVTKHSAQIPYAWPNGTGLKIRIMSTQMQIGIPALLYAMMYDWMYADFTSQQKADMQTSLANLCIQMENDYANAKESPYNDQFYGNGANSWVGGIGQFAASMAIYPDVPASISHLRWSMDVMFNRMLPVWQQRMVDGGWHESWNDYQNGNGTIAMKAFIVSPLLMWANSSGIGASTAFGTTYPWLKNWAYQMMYVARPDFVPLNYGDTKPWFTGEGNINSTGAPIGSLNGLAEIYSDTVLRGWARLVNGGSSPDGFEPSAWPYYTPDNTGKPETSRSGLPLCRNFSGWGMVICRSGWGEDDTWMSFRYGDSAWSHQHFDLGQFNIFKQGSLAIDSGTYQAGTFSKHDKFYSVQSIAHNVVTVTDSADVYSAQKVEVIASDGTDDCETIPNDGGQRRTGSNWQSYYTGGGCTGGPNTNVLMNSPDDKAGWLRGRQFFHGADLLTFSPYPNITTPTYAYMAVDLTDAYQTSTSGKSGTPGYGMSNRTQRLQKYVRHLIWIPRGAAGYVVVYDQVVSTDSAFAKKWLIHTINQPTVTGSKFVASRTENAVSKPYPGVWPGGWMLSSLTHANGTCGVTNGCYQYGGALTGYSVAVNGTNTLTKVGGAAHEFDDGAGTNQNDCQQGQTCADSTDSFGLGDSTAGCKLNTICPTSAAGPYEPGAWRIEVTPASAATQDWFVHVMLAQASSDTNIVSTAPSASTSGSNFIVTWKDNSDTCTYTLTLPRNGIGGTVTATGVGCTNVI